MVTVIVQILYENETEETLSQWLREEIVEQGLLPELRKNLGISASSNEGARHGVQILYTPILDGSKSTDEVLAELKQVIEKKEAQKEKENQKFVILLLVCFWDGFSENSKVTFGGLKQLSDAGSDVLQRFSQSLKLQNTQLEFLLQALNAKKGQHTMKQSKTALITSLSNKLSKSNLLTEVGPNKETNLNGDGTTSNSNDNRNNNNADGAVSKEGGNETAGNTSIGKKDISCEALEEVVECGQGECFVVLSAPSKEDLEQQIETLQANATKINVGVSAVLLEPKEVNLSNPKRSEWAQEFLLRRHGEGGVHIQMRFAMCGNVDSGKSTLTSVLTRGCRDDGRGFARAFVFNHKHESVTGRTSSISENHLGFSATGDVVNYQLGAVQGANSRSFTPQELSSKSSKVLTLYDLAGHERYLKTTVLGMTRNMPDYACVVISANNGIQRMTKEHLALCLALKLPFFIVITRVDATPPNVLKETLQDVNKLMKIPTVKKLPYPINVHDEMVLAAKNLKNDRIAPIFQVSNVTGDGINLLTRFLDLLPQRKDWRKARGELKQMIIDSTFFVTGVGTVAGGIITQGVFHVNDTVLLGPDGLGHYRPVSIKSIHVKGVERPYAEAGNDAALCLKKEKRSAIRKGNILTDVNSAPAAFWQFEAEVTILYHSTTISVNYEPVIHSTTVRQSARITFVEKEVLRTGDKSNVRFHFLYRPEFMYEGQRLIFREGRTKGIGIVTKMITEPDNSFFARYKIKNQASAAAT